MRSAKKIIQNCPDFNSKGTICFQCYITNAIYNELKEMGYYNASLSHHEGIWSRIERKGGGMAVVKTVKDYSSRGGNPYCWHTVCIGSSDEKNEMERIRKKLKKAEFETLDP